MPEEYDTDFDFELGAGIFGDARRTGAAIGFEFKPYRDELLLHPWEPSGDALLSALDEEIAVQVGEDLDSGRCLVTEVAGDLGLLDATRVTASSDSDVSTGELVAERFVEWIFDPTASYRGIPVPDLVGTLMADQEFSGALRWLTEFVAPHVLPDLIPSAAAIGIACWCWRNGTAVEDWHLPSDVLMAKVSISATRAIMEYADPYEGIDWQGVEESLTSETWQLPDGRAVSELHGIQPDPLAGRAPRDSMLPEFEGIEDWVPRPYRTALCAAVSDGALRIERLSLPDGVVASPEADKHIRLRWNPASPLRRAGTAVVSHWEQRGIDPGCGHLHGQDIRDQDAPYFANFGWSHFRSIPHCLTEYGGIEWLEVVHPTRARPLDCLRLVALDKARVELLRW